MHFTGVYIKLKRSIYKNPLGKLTEKTAVGWATTGWNKQTGRKEIC